MANWIQQILTRLGSPAGASISVDIAAIEALVDDLETRLAAGDVAETVATFVYDETNAGAQIMLALAITARSKVGAIWIDMVNVTQDTTIFLEHKIDGAIFRIISTHPWVVADDDGVLIAGFTAYRDIRVTLQCGGGGAGNVNVPYAIV